MAASCMFRMQLGCLPRKPYSSAPPPRCMAASSRSTGSSPPLSLLMTSPGKMIPRVSCKSSTSRRCSPPKGTIRQHQYQSPPPEGGAHLFLLPKGLREVQIEGCSRSLHKLVFQNAYLGWDCTDGAGSPSSGSKCLERCVRRVSQ